MEQRTLVYRPITLFIAIGYLLLLPSLVLAEEVKPMDSIRPNIIVFMVDDMGWQDTSVPFWKEPTSYNQLYHTPNMERLASEGMKFTQAYASAVCSPTRISFITGMNAARHKVTNWTLHKNQVQPMESSHPTLSFPRWNVNGVTPFPTDSLAVYATPLPKLLQDAGYHTIHVGKAHYGAIGTAGADPKNLGYDINIAGHAAGAPGSYLGKDHFGNTSSGRQVWAVPGLEGYHGKEVFLTEALTIEALHTMDSAIQRAQPFFLNMAHYAIHTPITGDERYLSKYTAKGLDSIEARYASMIEGMDKSLGDIMDFLKARSIDDNTIILFISDNGGLSAVARAGEPHKHNQPLSSGKGSAHEGGVRVPMLIKWPGVVSPGSETDQLVIIEDFFPTILEIAEISTFSTVQTVDGISFMPILDEEKVEQRSLFWHYPNEWGPSGPGIGASSSIRRGDWKFIYYHADERMELFNLKEDIGETKNLITENHLKAEDLAIELSNYLISVNAQMPINKENSEIVRMPIEALQRK